MFGRFPGFRQWMRTAPTSFVRGGGGGWGVGAGNLAGNCPNIKLVFPLLAQNDHVVLPKIFPDYYLLAQKWPLRLQPLPPPPPPPQPHIGAYIGFRQNSSLWPFLESPTGGGGGHFHWKLYVPIDIRVYKSLSEKITVNANSRGDQKLTLTKLITAGMVQALIHILNADYCRAY